MHRFAQRRSLKMHRIHGEAASAEDISFEADRANIEMKLSSYTRDNIYNFDETALFYTAPPRTTISVSGFMGTKESKKRLTVGLVCNADGTDKFFEPLTIGNAQRPRSFSVAGKKMDSSAHGFHLYFYNQNAWMTKKIFKVFLRRFDNVMQLNNKKVLLVLDNFAGHNTDYEPTNVELLFLPPNTTSKLQPLDGGIIRTFKAHFKRTQFQRAYRTVSLLKQGFTEVAGPIDKIFEVSQLEAMKWIRTAWNSVKPETIKNCWDATLFREFACHNEGNYCTNLFQFGEQLCTHTFFKGNVNAANLASLEETELSTDITKAVGDITQTGLVPIGACPVTEIDPEYERNALQRVITSESDILPAVLAEYAEMEREEAEEDIIPTEDNQDAPPFEVTYTSKEKLLMVSQVMRFLEEEGKNDAATMKTLEEVRVTYEKACVAKQAKVTSYFEYVNKQN